MLLVGHWGGDAISTGTANVGLGYQVLGALTTGSSNVAIGGYALDAATTQSDNTAIGVGALGANIAASNTAVGRSALNSKHYRHSQYCLWSKCFISKHNWWL